VTDGTGNMLGSARLNAVGEWMTEKMVTFKGSVSYKVPSGVKDGYIVVKKNNASGNPAMDQSVKASVNF
jgi:formylmethanofuran dehydrogenase subunit C